MIKLDEGKLLENIQIKNHIPEDKICVEIFNVAISYGISVKSQVEEVKIGGTFSKTEKAVVIYNSKRLNDYYQYAIIQTSHGMYTYVKIYMVGASKNYKNNSKSNILKNNSKILKKELDKRAKNGESVGFTFMGYGIAKARSAILNPNKQHLNEENEYYQFMNKIVVESINNLNSKVWQESYNVQNVASTSSPESDSSNNLDSSGKLKYEPPKVNVNQNNDLTSEENNQSYQSKDENITKVIGSIIVLIGVGIFGYYYTVAGGIKGAIICIVLFFIMLLCPGILQFIIAGIIGAALKGWIGIPIACVIWYIILLFLGIIFRN